MTRFNFSQIKAGIPGTTTNTTLGALLSMQFDRGVNPIVAIKLDKWVQSILDTTVCDYDSTLSEVFDLPNNGDKFFMPE